MKIERPFFYGEKGFLYVDEDLDFEQTMP